VLCDLDQVLSDTIWAIAIAIPVTIVILWSMTVAVTVGMVGLNGGFVFEVRSIQRGRESVGRFEVTHEVTLVVQANLECDLLHAQEARLQKILRSLHPQQSQITNRRHPDIGFKDVTKAPD